MPHIFPIAQAEIPRAETEIENFKSANDFDRYVAELIARRAVSFRIYDRSRIDEITARALPRVKEHVNRALRDVVCSHDLLHSHDQNPPHRRHYIPEDTLRTRVRQIVLHVYGPDADRKMVRKKVTGCMQAVTLVLNTHVMI